MTRIEQIATDNIIKSVLSVSSVFCSLLKFNACKWQALPILISQGTAFAIAGHMKRILLYLFTINLFISCSNSQTEEQKAAKEAEKAKKNITKRDESITRANAYNNLFLDTSAVEKFISEKKI